MGDHRAEQGQQPQIPLPLPPLRNIGALRSDHTAPLYTCLDSSDTPLAAAWAAASLSLKTSQLTFNQHACAGPQASGRAVSHDGSKGVLTLRDMLSAGNTCFMNANLQILLHAPPVQAVLCSMPVPGPESDCPLTPKAEDSFCSGEKLSLLPGNTAQEMADHGQVSSMAAADARAHVKGTGETKTAGTETQNLSGNMGSGDALQPRHARSKLALHQRRLQLSLHCAAAIQAVRRWPCLLSVSTLRLQRHLQVQRAFRHRHL